MVHVCGMSYVGREKWREIKFSTLRSFRTACLFQSCVDKAIPLVPPTTSARRQRPPDTDLTMHRPGSRKRPWPVPSSAPGGGVISSSGTRRYALSGGRRARTATGRAATRTGTGTARTGTTRTARTGTARTAREDDIYLVALIENRGREVGLAAYNLRSFHVELRQYADGNTFAATMTALTVFNPVEIVLSQSSAAGSLDRAIQENPYLTEVQVRQLTSLQQTLLCHSLASDHTN